MGVFSLKLDLPDDTNHLVDLYNGTMRSIVIEDAPVRTKEMSKITLQPQNKHRRYC